VVLGTQTPREFIDRRVERLESSALELGESIAAAHEMQRRASLRARFCQRQDAGRKLELGQIASTAAFRPARLPMETPSDHQMENHKQIVVQLENDALAEPLHADDALADQVRERRLDGAQQEWRLESNFLERLPNDAPAERFDVHSDVG
jgi:hypothetical protein